MSNNYFQGTSQKPYHLSVGAVLVNAEKKVACHHFQNASFSILTKPVDDAYILMRETIEPGETLEGALIRGLEEEFGAKAKLVTYIGSLKSQFPTRGDKGIFAEKTTLYFLAECVDCDPAKRKNDDEESQSAIEWQDIDFLIPKMREQAKRLGRNDIDESEMLERVRSMIYIESN